MISRTSLETVVVDYSGTREKYQFQIHNILCKLGYVACKVDLYEKTGLQAYNRPAHLFKNHGAVVVADLTLGEFITKISDLA